MKWLEELTENEVILAPTQEIANKLCNRMHELGMVWSDGSTYLDNSDWDKYRERTCYHPYKGKYSSGVNYSRDVVFTIEDLKDFNKDYNSTTSLETLSKRIEKLEKFGQELEECIEELKSAKININNYGVNLSIFNDEDIFFVKTGSDSEWIIKGNLYDYKVVNSEHYCITTDKVFRGQKLLTYRDDIIKLRFADREEVKLFYQKFPEDQEINFSILNETDVFFVRAVGDPYGWVAKGNVVEKSGGLGYSHHLGESMQMVNTNITMNKKDVVELRTATEEEKKILYDKIPQAQPLNSQDVVLYWNNKGFFTLSRVQERVRKHTLNLKRYKEVCELYYGDFYKIDLNLPLQPQLDEFLKIK